MRSSVLYVLHCYGKSYHKLCVIILCKQIPQLMLVNERQNLIIFLDQCEIRTPFSILQFFKRRKALLRLLVGKLIR